MLSNRFTLSAFYQMEISYFSKMLFFCCCQGEERVSCPQKKAEGVLTFNWVDPDQNKRFTSAPVSLHPSTPWLEIACAHTQLVSAFSSLHCPGGKEQGLSPALFKHIASSRFPPPVPCFHPNPSRKLTAEFTSWVSTQDEKILFFFFLLLYLGLSLKHSLTLRERYFMHVPPEKKR